MFLQFFGFSKPLPAEKAIKRPQRGFESFGHHPIENVQHYNIVACKLHVSFVYVLGRYVEMTYSLMIFSQKVVVGGFNSLE